MTSHPTPGHPATTSTDPYLWPTAEVHAHVLLPAIEVLVDGSPGLAEARALDARRNGPAALAVNGPMVRERIPRLTDAGVRLAAMDAQGVDVQLVGPSPSQYRHWTDEATADKVCRLANEGTAAHCSAAPDRLKGLGLIPLHHPSRAVPALEHVLEQGLLGAEICSRPLGAGRGNRRGALPAPVRLHPRRAAGPVVPVQHRRPAHGERRGAVPPHLLRGLDRHPGLRLIAARGGGYLPTHIGRADHAWSVRSDAGTDCAQLPSSYLKRLRFDSLVHDPHVLRALIAATGADRVLLGSDFPFDMGTEDPVGALRAAQPPEADFHAVRGSAAAAHLTPHTGGNSS